MRNLLSSDELNYVLEYLLERFGIPKEYFDPYLLLRTKKVIWCISKDHYDQIDHNHRIESIGLRILSGRFFHPEPLKPSTSFSQLLNGKVCKNIFDLNADELKTYLNREMIDKDLKTDRGYVFLRYHGLIVGLGFYNGKGAISSHYPKKLVQYAHINTIF